MLMQMLSHMPVAIFVAIFVVVMLATVFAARGSEQWPFAKKRVLSECEQVAYWRLLKAAPGFIVLAQVALSSIVDVKRGTQRPRRHRNRFSQKSVDFALCRKDGSVFVVIEVDDKSHAAINRANTDRVKDKILEAAGIPVLRWKASPLPSEDAMRSAIAALTAPQPAANEALSRE